MEAAGSRVATLRAVKNARKRDIDDVQMRDPPKPKQNADAPTIRGLASRVRIVVNNEKAAKVPSQSDPRSKKITVGQLRLRQTQSSAADEAAGQVRRSKNNVVTAGDVARNRQQQRAGARIHIGQSRPNQPVNQPKSQKKSQPQRKNATQQVPRIVMPGSQ
jgi:hypothetical protein